MTVDEKKILAEGVKQVYKGEKSPSFKERRIIERGGWFVDYCDDILGDCEKVYTFYTEYV